MKRTLTLSLLAAMLLPLATAAVAAPGSVRGFQLPPAPAPTPSNAPEVQGPVDSEAPIATRPRDIAAPNDQAAPAETATETANGTPPASVNTVSRPVIQPIPQATRSAPQPRRAAPQPSRTQNPPSPPVQSVEPSTTPVPDPALDGALPDGPASLPTDNAPADTTPNAASPATQFSGSDALPLPNYLWWIGGLALLVLLLIGAVMWWRQRAPLAAGVPTIEPPLARSQKPADPAPDSAAEAQAAAQDTTADAATPLLPIQIKAEAISLSRSIMNAALSYRFEFMNIGGKDLEEISISADMISAHGKAPIDEQVAHSGSELPFVSIIAAIKKGGSQELKGELRLPVGSIRWIAQGSAKLYVPLVRLRVEAEGLEPVVHTFVVGIRPEAKGGKLRPFRLDEMPQTYRTIGFRALT
ncbi:hypothetical protein HKD42_01990 [Altererythrobacter sp. RZ02]|uniref:Uncharacterized protein n=1 Tax=Pontixanthobacter rizhaonensis TaxID=2730337 RepID=A0A848QJ93_9SPHN|nr:hypothetical protein [Pontixanthobacter rizhaonensis]NMW30829.1 hypothetical protein [Pontixanthobacter rizhaonensis]